MKYVMQITFPVSSLEEARRIATGLRQQEGCIDARYTEHSAIAHFPMYRDTPPEVLPEACSIVPASVVESLQPGETRVSLGGDTPASAVEHKP